ncbi:MAG: PilZ domain-containing protein [Candidatus Eisenbacteria bacterium]
MAVKKVTKRERRRSERVDAKVSMRVEGTHDGDSTQIVTESQNISSSGVYCMSSHYLPPLSRVQLTLVMPRIPGHDSAQELLKCEGMVVRCELSKSRKHEHPYELACMFADMPGPRRQRIADFVTWRNLQSLRNALKASPRRSPSVALAKKKTAARKKTAVRRTATPVAKKRKVAGASRTGR